MGGAGRGGGGGGEKDRAEYNESQELENLQRVFQILSNQKPGTGLSEKDQPKVSPDKLAEALKKLQYKCKRTDVEDMIWEVDEDCDGLISWDEFKAMFYRVRHDKTGWEPRRLFNVVEFMMHDKVRVRSNSGQLVATTASLVNFCPHLPSPCSQPTRRTNRHRLIWMSAWRSSSGASARSSSRRASTNSWLTTRYAAADVFWGGERPTPLTCLPGTFITSHRFSASVRAGRRQGHFLHRVSQDGPEE